MKLLALTSILLITACTFSKEVYLPDGALGHSISCGGTLNNFASCFNKAGEVCGGSGYDILDTQGEVIPFTNAQYRSSGSAHVSGNNSGVFGSAQSNSSASYNKSAFVSRNLFVKCKE